VAYRNKSHCARQHWQSAAKIAILTSVILLCSCVDLGKVGEFAKASQDVGATFKSITVEGSASCERATSYLLPGQQAPDCDFYAKVAPDLLKINDALFAYICGLGKLATADPSKVADGLKDVTAGLKQADPKISQAAQDQAKAATGLATALANVLTSEYRQHALAKVIEEANGDAEHPGPIKQVTAFLSDYAAEKYLQGLDDEHVLETNYCDEKAEKYRVSEPLALDLFKRKCAADDARIQQKKDAIAKYRKALSVIAIAHQKLYESRNTWTAKQLATTLGPEILQLTDAASSMEKAF
jgi:hypothetical protein